MITAYHTDIKTQRRNKMNKIKLYINAAIFFVFAIISIKFDKDFETGRMFSTASLILFSIASSLEKSKEKAPTEGGVR